MTALPDGTLVLARNGIGRIHKSGNLKPGCSGYWVIDSTGDPGQDWSRPTFTQHVTPAVIGETVCPHRRFTHDCGLTHVTAEQLAWLPTKDGAS
jgi:hypothetical protein